MPLLQLPKFLFVAYLSLGLVKEIIPEIICSSALVLQLRESESDLKESKHKTRVLLSHPSRCSPAYSGSGCLSLPGAGPAALPHHAGLIISEVNSQTSLSVHLKSAHD